MNLQQKNMNKPTCFVLFLGKGRCGSSLCAALINCHPNSVILNQKEFINYNYTSKKELFDYLLKSVNDPQYIWPQYKSNDYYWIRNYENLKVLGTKRQGTLIKTNKDFDKLDKLKKIISIPIKFIHVYRNPYDNIATIFNESQRPKHIKLGQNMKSLDKAIKYYFNGIKIANSVMEREDSLNIKHEELVKNPNEILKMILKFLDLSIIESHIEFCKSLIWDKPRKTRTSVDWSIDQITRVKEMKNNFKFLQKYKWEE